MERIIEHLKSQNWHVEGGAEIDMLFAWKDFTSTDVACTYSYTVFKSLFEDKYKVCKGYTEYLSSNKQNIVKEKERVVIRSANIEKVIAKLQ